MELSPNDLAVIDSIKIAGPATVDQLSRRLDRQPSRVRTTVERLFRAGHLVRVGRLQGKRGAPSAVLDVSLELKNASTPGSECKLSQRLLTVIADAGPCSVADLVVITDINAHVVRRHLKDAVSTGQLHKVGQIQPAVGVPRDLFWIEPSLPAALVGKVVEDERGRQATIHELSLAERILSHLRSVGPCTLGQVVAQFSSASPQGIGYSIRSLLRKGLVARAQDRRSKSRGARPYLYRLA